MKRRGLKLAGWARSVWCRLRTVTAPWPRSRMALNNNGEGNVQVVFLVIYFVLKEKWPEVRLMGCSKWLDRMGRGPEGGNGQISNQEVWSSHCTDL